MITIWRKNDWSSHLYFNRHGTCLIIAQVITYVQGLLHIPPYVYSLFEQLVLGIVMHWLVHDGKLNSFWTHVKSVFCNHLPFCTILLIEIYITAIFKILWLQCITCVLTRIISINDVHRYMILVEFTFLLIFIIVKWIEN